MPYLLSCPSASPTYPPLPLIMLATVRSRRASAQKSYVYTDPLKDVELEASDSEEDALSPPRVATASPKWKVEVEMLVKSSTKSPSKERAAGRHHEAVDASAKLAQAIGGDPSSSPVDAPASIDLLPPPALDKVPSASDEVVETEADDGDANGESDDDQEDQSDYKMDTPSEDSYEACKKPSGKSAKAAKSPKTTKAAAPATPSKRKKAAGETASTPNKVKADPDAPSPSKKAKASPAASASGSTKFQSTGEVRLAFAEALIKAWKPHGSEFDQMAKELSGSFTGTQLQKVGCRECTTGRDRG